VPEVGWIRDFADPQTMLYVPFYGPAITPTNNSNWGQVNNPQINAAMEGRLPGRQSHSGALTRGPRSMTCWSTRPSRSRGSSTRSRTSSPRRRGINDLWDGWRVGLQLHLAGQSVINGSSDRRNPGAPFAAPRVTGRHRSMTGYIIRRLLWGVVLLILVIAVTFDLLPAAVGEPGGCARAVTARPRSSPRSARTSGSTTRSTCSSGTT
jgi:hypothetical protein